MLKKIAVMVLTLMMTAGSAMAAHSSYSPMAPRQISAKASHADYSYGLTILPGNSIDSLYEFNKNYPWKMNYYVFDRYLLRPVAHGYAKLPQFARSGVHNFLENISDINNTVNNTFVGDFRGSAYSISRFLINTTVGVLGLFDVASAMGLEKKPMEFDTVMGRAGIDSGAYLMIPVMGMNTERSLHASFVDNWPFYFFNPLIGLSFKAVRTVDSRSALIDQEGLIDNAVDPYVQTRTIYLQYLEGKVHPQAVMDVKKDENVEEFLDEIDK